jgi:hypothetical protein
VDKGSVDTDAPAGGELRDDQSDLLAGRQAVQWVVGVKGGDDLERGQRGDVEEAGGSSQRRDPQSASAVPPGECGEGPVGKEAGDPAVQLDRFQHRCQAGRLSCCPCSVLDGHLASVEAHVGEPVRLRHDLLAPAGRRSP